MDRILVLPGPTDVTDIVKVKCASRDHREAFYVLDLGDVVNKHRQWLDKLPRVKPFYAMKANNDPRVLQVLAALGAGFDCASMGEIKQLLELGVLPDLIIYANTVKPHVQLGYAATVGVDLTTFDNKEELYKIKEIHPKAKLLLRIKCDATSLTYSKVTKKFGCDAKSEAPKLLQLCKELGLSVVGITFYVGSGCREPLVFRRAISAARVLFDLGRETGHKMDMLDVGGGFLGDKGTSIDEFATVINTALADFFPTDYGAVTVISEPGRYYMSSCATMATRIHSKKAVYRDAEETELEHVMYYVDEGIHTSFNFTTLLGVKSRIPRTVRNHGNDATLISSSVWGPTCNSMDQVNDNVLLPELGVTDWLIYENMGAYARVAASTFNGFPVPVVHAVIDKDSWALVKDLFPLTDNRFTVEHTSNTFKPDL